MDVEIFTRMLVHNYLLATTVVTDICTDICTSVSVKLEQMKTNKDLDVIFKNKENKTTSFM